MKKFIFISVSILIFCSIISCESMDATYKDFVKDGPIMYLITTIIERFNNRA